MHPDARRAKEDRIELLETKLSDLRRILDGHRSNGTFKQLLSRERRYEAELDALWQELRPCLLDTGEYVGGLPPSALRCRAADCDNFVSEQAQFEAAGYCRSCLYKATGQRDPRAQHPNGRNT